MNSVYCTNCGNKLNDNDKFCTSCGEKRDRIVINKNTDNVNGNSVRRNDSGMKIASIVLGSISILAALMFIFAPVGLLLSIIGLVLGLCALKKGKNVVGILLSSIGLVLSIGITVFIVCMFIFMFNEIDTNNYQYEDYYDQFYDEFNDYYDEYGTEKF